MPEDETPRGGRGGKRAGAGRKAGRPPKSETEKTPEALFLDVWKANCGEIQSGGFTTALLEQFSIEAMATVMFHVRRGNPKIACWFLDRFMPKEAEPGFEERMRGATPEEVQAQLVEQFCAIGLERDLALSLVEQIKAKAKADNEAARTQKALSAGAAAEKEDE